MRYCAFVAIASCCLSGCGDDKFAEAKQAVIAIAKDPGSVQFQDLSICSADKSIISGKYNAKNGFGGYVGFNWFFYEKGRVIPIDDADFSALSARCYGPEITRQVEALNSDSVDSSSVPASDRSKYPYITRDGVDIRNATDEANWKKYGTTDPRGGE